MMRSAAEEAGPNTGKTNTEGIYDWDAKTLSSLDQGTSRWHRNASETRKDRRSSTTRITKIDQRSN
jgi:hypothetical protein